MMPNMTCFTLGSFIEYLGFAALTGSILTLLLVGYVETKWIRHKKKKAAAKETA